MKEPSKTSEDDDRELLESPMSNGTPLVSMALDDNAFVFSRGDSDAISDSNAKPATEAPTTIRSEKITFPSALSFSEKGTFGPASFGTPQVRLKYLSSCF